MPETILRTRVEAIRRLARRGAQRPLVKVLGKTRGEDVAAAMPHLAPAEQRFVFKHLEDDEMASELLAHVGESDLASLVKDLPLQRLVELLDIMEVDDETDVIARLPEEIREQVMARIQNDDREHVEELLAYPDDSAAGIMQPVAFRIHEDATCREAIQALQEAEEVESVFYLFVENEANQLVGVTSLRNLLTNPANAALSEIMTTDVITVPPELDQEEVARIVSRYDLLAIPVVDEHRRLAGIVTVDDVIDVIKEEAAEDMMLMVGVHQEVPGDPTGVLKAARQRVLWLLITLLGGIGAAELINLWEADIKTYAALAGFLPVVIGMGGNVGSQAATITVRGIALGHISPRDILRVAWKESRVGLMLGLGYGVLLGVYCVLRFPDEPFFGVGVAGAILVAMASAAVAGTMVPLILERMRIDPAVATMPFVTTLMDNVGVVIYFLITTLFLSF